MIRPNKPHLAAAALLLALLPLSACIFATGVGDPVTGINPGAVTTAGSGLALKADKQILVIGDKLPITTGVSAASSLGKPIFASSDTKVATVDGNGVVTAVNVGPVTITAVLANKKGTIDFRVVTTTSPEVLLVNTVAISPGSQTVEKVGSNLVFTALAKDAGAATIPGITFFWFSSNPNVATITQAGVLTIVGSGTTEVTASAGDKKSAATVISVPGGSANVNVDFGAL